MDPKESKDARKNTKFIQINMQNAIHVVGEINNYILKNDIDVALLQEPYNRGGVFSPPRDTRHYLDRRLERMLWRPSWSKKKLTS